jgi:alpha-1,6-mannosyltransferase
MTRIAHIANMYGPKSGGLKTAMRELSNEYALRGHEVLLVVPGAKNEYSMSGQVTTISVAAPRIPFSGGYRIILDTGAVIDILKNFDPEVLEVSDRTTLLRVARWARRREIPTVFFAHERVDGVVKAFGKLIPFKGFLTRRWNIFTAKSVDRIVATTNFAAGEFVDLGMQISNTYSSHLVSIPLGVDLEVFDPSNRYPENDLYGNLPEQFLLACTRLSKEKDPLFILEIARSLADFGIDTPIVIAGSGPLEKKIAQIIDSEDLNVILLGFVADKDFLATLMSQASIFLAVGPIETFGLAALESLASGTPVICRQEAAISEIICLKSGSALPRNAVQWRNQIIDFLRHDRESIRSHARARAETFSWERSANMLLDLYDLERIA